MHTRVCVQWRIQRGGLAGVDPPTPCTPLEPLQAPPTFSAMGIEEEEEKTEEEKGSKGKREKEENEHPGPYPCLRSTTSHYPPSKHFRAYTNKTTKGEKESIAAISPTS